MKKIAVLISGQGNNLQAIIDACQRQQISAEIVCVISNKANAFGLIRAKSAGIFSRVFLRNNFESNLAMDQSIADELDKFDVDLIVLAGYMKILAPEFIQRFEGKIINIHPSLLPKYPGLNTYQKALDAGDREHGTTYILSMRKLIMVQLYYKPRCLFLIMIRWKLLKLVLVNRNIVFIRSW